MTGLRCITSSRVVFWCGLWLWSVAKVQVGGNSVRTRTRNLIQVAELHGRRFLGPALTIRRHRPDPSSRLLALWTERRLGGSLRRMWSEAHRYRSYPETLSEQHDNESVGFNVVSCLLFCPFSSRNDTLTLPYLIVWIARGPSTGTERLREIGWS
jgi:hypothetical protein